MKLARFDDGRTGVVLDRGGSPCVVDVLASLDAFGVHDERAATVLAPLSAEGAVSWVPLIESWEHARASLSALADWAENGEGATLQALGEVRLLPPLVSPSGRIFGFGANFASHLAAAVDAIGAEADYAFGIRDFPPVGFFVIPGTVIGHEDAFNVPPGATAIDYEAEVAVVFATGGRAVSPGDLRIWGITAFNDLSIRDPHLGSGLVDLDQGPLSWALQKNWDGSNACGPWLVVDEDLDPGALSVLCRVNGEVRQQSSTSEMVRSFAEGAAYLSTFITLQPGDVLLSGTPAGTAIERGVDGRFLELGDVVEVEVEGVGVLRNTRAG
jgi:2-keto-4-pentenoate hydratase/2-oxohepta-3-ene-1,7-dioic acid hydratase in catechol pathway